MIGGAFALKRKRKRESLLLAGNKTNQDQNVNNFFPGILSFGPAINDHQQLPTNQSNESNQQHHHHHIHCHPYESTGIIYYDNRGVDSAKCREMEQLNSQSNGLTVIAIFILGIGLIILLISSILSGSVTTPITTLGLIFVSIGLLIFIIKCLTSYFIAKSKRLFQPDHLIKSNVDSTICKSTSSPTWIHLPNLVDSNNLNNQLGERISKTMSTIILDPSKLSTIKSFNHQQSTNSESLPNYIDHKSLLINQQLITSLASSVDSNYIDEQQANQFNHQSTINDSYQCQCDHLNCNNQNCKSTQQLTPVSIAEV